MHGASGHDESRVTSAPERWLFAIVVGVAFALYFRVFRVFFGVDDFFYLAQARAPVWPGLERAFAERYLSHTVAFVLSPRLFGTSAAAYHVAPFALHIASACLIFRLLRRVLPSDRVLPAAATLLFMIHPAAYTILAWPALGFEEISALTLTLLVVHLFLTYRQRPTRWGVLALSVLLAITACGFKNQAVMIPAYLVAFSAVVMQQEGVTRRGLVQLAASLLPFVLFDLWYFSQIVPQLPQATNAAYATNFSLRSLGSAYLRLLPNTLNVFPFGREALGYQDSLPSSLPAIVGDGVWYRTALLIMGIAIYGYSARVLGRGVFAACMAAVVMVGLFFAASIPHHLYEYYTYFSLPAACGVLAMPVTALCRLRAPAARWSVAGRVVAGGALAVYAFAEGTVLHSSNGFVRQATHAAQIDAFVTARMTPGQTLLFAPPSETAYMDSSYGASIQALHPAMNLRISYLTGSDQPPEASTPDPVLVAFDKVGDRDYQTYHLDQAQWIATHRTSLAPGDELTQPIGLRTDGFEEIHLLLRSGWGTDVTVEIDEVRQMANETLDVSALSTVTVHCPAGGAARYYPIPVPRQAHSAGKRYQIRLRLSGGQRNPIAIDAGPTSLTFRPFRRQPSVAGALTPSELATDETLVFRVVVVD